MEREETAKIRKKLHNPAAGGFCYKIPDMPKTARFIPPKPFDIFYVKNGRSFALEIKYQKKLAAFGLRFLEASQIAGLTDFDKSGGYSFVILAVRVGRLDSRFYFWEWANFQRARLLKADLIKAGNYLPRKKDEIDLAPVFDFVS